jgi:crotonobetainyl-CoA:carnitine CoA-transferase CaiB-like acyl-CoA transferase
MPTTNTRRGPLEDLTVIDCTRALAGPFGAGLLADLGARVVKIEPPAGDGYRNIPPFLAVRTSGRPLPRSTATNAVFAWI